MIDDFVSGKDLENKVKLILEENGLEIKEQPLLTPFHLKFDFLVSDLSGNLFAVEVTKRNSIEDIQRLCFRSIACKKFHKKIKTIIIVSAFKKGLSKLRSIGMLVRFCDMFLFEEDLELLPKLFGPDSKSVFFEFVKQTLSSEQPEFGKVLTSLQENRLLEMKELSKKCDLPLSRLKRLIKRNVLSLSNLGLVECVNDVCRLAEKFRQNPKNSQNYPKN